MRLIRVGLLLALFMGSLPLFAEEPAPKATTVTPQLSYSADLSLAYVDRLNNPVGGSKYPNLGLFSKTDEPIAYSRSVGLAKLDFGIDLSLPNESRLHVQLRPDVLNRDEKTYVDYDTRTGPVYFAQSKAKFLDEYYLEFSYEANLDLAFGVFRSISEDYSAYAPILGFGLQVRFPERFAAARINWRQGEASYDTQESTVFGGWFADLMVLQGNEDRGEEQSFEEETQDTAPASKDAHLGVAGLGGYRFGDHHVLGLMVGTGKNEHIIKQKVAGSEIELKGQREEIYGQIFESYILRLPKLSTKFALDYRIMKEKWRSDDYSIQSRTHQSVMGSVSTQLHTYAWLFLGAHYGKSKMADDLDVDGYQLDFGALFNPKKNLFINALISEEHREKDQAGKHEGAYSIDGGQESVVRRFALELRYLFDKG